MEMFLGCDWGTSSLRLRLADITNLKIICEENTTRGVADTFTGWKASGQTDPSQRISFYLRVIDTCVKQMEHKLQRSLDHIPLVISGMASSSIGMMELPYQSLPFALDGSTTGIHHMEPTGNFNHTVLLVSGVRSEDDIMRGEETQLLGCAAILGAVDEAVFVFPGTHSKHLLVRNRQLLSIKTFMTGEFFSLLSDKSILHGSIEKHTEFPQPVYVDHFSRGVEDAVTTNLLHAAFRVRTNDLLGKHNKKENFSYLGGLLIGTELKELLQAGTKLVYVCCGEALATFYEKAIEVLGLSQKAKVLPASTADEAVVRGQYIVFHHFKHLP